MDVDMDLIFDLSQEDKVGIFGTPLVEVFNVLINKKIEVYGTFNVEDDKGIVNFFKTHGVVKTKDTLLSLTTPPRVIEATGKITFHLDLEDSYGNEFINGSFTLNLMDESTADVLDKYQVARIDGKLGSAMVYYTIPIVALTATINVQLSEVNNAWGHLDVIGKVTARYGNNYGDNSFGEDEKQYTQFMLYEKISKDMPLQLKTEHVLPLSRSCIIVPAQSVCVIEMNLEFWHPDGQSEQLISYEFKVRPCIYGEHREKIKLNRCALEAVLSFEDEIDLS